MFFLEKVYKDNQTRKPVRSPQKNPSSPVGAIAGGTVSDIVHSFTDRYSHHTLLHASIQERKKKGRACQ